MANIENSRSSSSTTALGRSPSWPGRIIEIFITMVQRMAHVRVAWLDLLELSLVALWAIWVGRGYLNFSLNAFPRGDEMPMVTQTHFIWTLLPKCGACMLWNGFLNGGAPGLVDTVGANLHPITIITTLLWGVVNGTKVLLIAALAMAGMAQWWIGKILGLGRIPRLWTAGMAVIGGHLVGRMDNGGVILLFSMAAASLAIAPGLEMALTGRRRATILFGVTLALTWVAGGGYIQVAFASGVLPCFVFFLFDKQLRLQKLWKELALALILSVLLAAIFWVPLLHFWPNMVKDGDAYLSGYSPLQYLPLNLVIQDWKFFNIEVLGHTLNLYHYYMYIGWVPVILAVLSLRFWPQVKGRVLVFMFSAIGLLYLICSADFMKFVIQYIPTVGYLRYFYIGVGLVVPLILALAGIGLDNLLKISWPGLGLILPGGRGLALSSAWLVLGLPLLLAFKPGYENARAWLVAVPVNPSPAVMQALSTPTTEWVSTPSGQYQWIPFMLDHGAKLPAVFTPWNWKDREKPPAYLEAQLNPSGNPVEGSIERIGDIDIVKHTEAEYAFIATAAAADAATAANEANASSPCQAKAQGGNIDVTCQSDQAGILTVRETVWAGWSAWIDGKRTDLVGDKWLAVQALPGRHTYTFRYRPWDVPLGALISLIGVVMSIWLARRKGNRVDSPGLIDYP